MDKEDIQAVFGIYAFLSLVFGAIALATTGDNPETYPIIKSIEESCVIFGRQAIPHWMFSFWNTALYGIWPAVIAKVNLAFLVSLAVSLLALLIAVSLFGMLIWLIVYLPSTYIKQRKHQKQIANDLARRERRRQHYLHAKKVVAELSIEFEPKDSNANH